MFFVVCGSWDFVVFVFFLYVFVFLVYFFDIVVVRIGNVGSVVEVGVDVDKFRDIFCFDVLDYDIVRIVVVWVVVVSMVEFVSVDNGEVMDGDGVMVVVLDNFVVGFLGVIIFNENIFVV